MTANPYTSDDYKRTRRLTVTVPVLTPIPAEQRPLPLDPPQPVDAELTIEARFRRFDEANPHIYADLAALAWDYVNTGARRVSVKALYELLRGRVSTSGETYVLNNDYTALYARKLADEGGLGRYIELRVRKAK